MPKNAMRAKDVVDQLVSQHDNIEQQIKEFFPLLEKVDEMDYAVQAKKKLGEISKLLDVHLKVEDKLLYPVLIKSPNKKIQEKAASFSEEMGDLLVVVTNYMEKWSTSTQIKLEPNAFQQDTKALVQKLSKRINRENNELFPLLISS